MKLTQLERNIGKASVKAFKAVCGNALNAYAFGLNDSQSLRIQCCAFLSDKLQMDDFAVDLVHEHHNAETAFEIGGIHDDVGDGFEVVEDGKRCAVDFAAYGSFAAAVLLCQLGIGLFALGVFVRQLLWRG